MATKIALLVFLSLISTITWADEVKNEQSASSFGTSPNFTANVVVPNDSGVAVAPPSSSESSCSHSWSEEIKSLYARYQNEVSVSLKQSREEAAKILRSAQAQADRIVDSAEQEARRIFDKIVLEGRQWDETERSLMQSERDSYAQEINALKMEKTIAEGRLSELNYNLTRREYELIGHRIYGFLSTLILLGVWMRLGVGKVIRYPFAWLCSVARFFREKLRWRRAVAAPDEGAKVHIEASESSAPATEANKDGAPAQASQTGPISPVEVCRKL